MKILFLAHLFPLPLDSGGKIKSFYTLKALSSKHNTYTLAYTRNNDEKLLIQKLQEISPQLRTIDLSRNLIKKVLDPLTNLISNKSFIINRDYRYEMRKAFLEVVESFKPDVVHIDHLQMAQFVDFNASYKVVLDNHNVESIIIKRIAETSESISTRLYASVEWPKLQRYELDICKRCNLVLTVSETDERTLVDMGVNSSYIDYVPIGVDTQSFKYIDRIKSSQNMLSLGTMSWPPNIDSMLYFTKDIMPIIRKQYLGCTLTIAGSNPSPVIQSLASEPDISVTGFVDDADELARKCGVFIVPLRSGSGVRVKILNALAMGLPIVSTTIGVEGLDVRNGEHLLIADTPADFAESVIRVLTDSDLAQKLGVNGRKFVCDNYSWETVNNRLLRIYDEKFQ